MAPFSVLQGLATLPSWHWVPTSPGILLGWGGNPVVGTSRPNQKDKGQSSTGATAPLAPGGASPRLGWGKEALF